MTFAENFAEVLSALNRCNVNYMLVGGFAVNFHGFNRSTSDLDIWVQPSLENKQKIFDALQQLGFSNENLQQFQQLDFERPFVFSVGLGPADVEIFNFISGVKYEEADGHKITFDSEGTLPVYFISLKDLIVNKMISGRPQDKVDVDELQRIEQFKLK